jgi:hypothetical protein
VLMTIAVVLMVGLKTAGYGHLLPQLCLQSDMLLDYDQIFYQNLNYLLLDLGAPFVVFVMRGLAFLIQFLFCIFHSLLIASERSIRFIFFTYNLCKRLYYLSFAEGNFFLREVCCHF